MKELTKNYFIHQYSGEVVLIDFQTYGYGMACVEFASFLFYSYEIKNFNDVEEFTKGNFHAFIELKCARNHVLLFFFSLS